MCIDMEGHARLELGIWDIYRVERRHKPVGDGTTRAKEQDGSHDDIYWYNLSWDI